jgi:hypothetical protein
MKYNSRNPLSPEAFEAVRTRIAEMSREELLAYLEWCPDIAEDMKFPQHPPYPTAHEHISTIPGAGSQVSGSKRSRAKP